MQLTNIRYCQFCSSKLDDNDSNSKSCPNCSKKYYAFPSVCIALILFTENNEFLLIKRSKEPDKGKLDFPGSFVKVGETVENSIKRVLLEELSTDKVNNLTYVGSSNDFYGGDTNIPIISLLFCKKVDQKVIESLVPRNDAEELLIIRKQDIVISQLAYKSMLDEISLVEEFIS